MRALLPVLCVLSCAASNAVGTGEDGQPLPAPGTPAWDERARRLLLAFDRDGSGDLDEVELRAVPCEHWTSLERGWSTALGVSFASAFGLAPGLIFRADRIGIAAPSRATAHALVTACLGAAPPPKSPDAVADAIRALDEFPGSSAWDSAVRLILLDHHDADASGALDTHLEIQAIACSTLGELELGAARSTGTHFAPLYGVTPGYIWVASALGFSEGVRNLLAERFEACAIPLD